MAGHSQFANIKHKKEKEDSKRTKLFTKLSRDITIAVRAGGKDPHFNPHLRLSIEKAKHANMPKENIERSIKKGSGELESDLVEEVIYEGYAPGGIAIIVEALTDNRNRTASEVRYGFSKYGGLLGETGSVAWLFNKVALFHIDKSENEEKIIEFMLENNLENLEEEKDFYIIKCESKDFYKISEKLEKFKVLSSSIQMITDNLIELDDEKRESANKVIEMLKELDDVQEVFSNLKNELNKE